MARLHIKLNSDPQPAATNLLSSVTRPGSETSISSNLSRKPNNNLCNNQPQIEKTWKIIDSFPDFCPHLQLKSNQSQIVYPYLTRQDDSSLISLSTASPHQQPPSTEFACSPLGGLSSFPHRGMMWSVPWLPQLTACGSFQATAWGGHWSGTERVRVWRGQTGWSWWSKILESRELHREKNQGVESAIQHCGQLELSALGKFERLCSAYLSYLAREWGIWRIYLLSSHPPGTEGLSYTSALQYFWLALLPG